MLPRDVDALSNPLGEGFFFDNLNDVLTRKDTKHSREDYLVRAIDFMDNALYGYRLNRKKGNLIVGQFIKNGKSTLHEYLRIIECMPIYLKEGIKNDKDMYKTLRDFKKTLIRAKDNKKVKEKDEKALLDLINNIRKKTLDEGSDILYNRKSFPFPVEYIV